MKRRIIIAFALLASILVISHGSVAASTTLIKAGAHSNETDFTNGTLDGVVVDGSGESAHVQLADVEKVDSYEDGDLTEWNTSAGGGSYTTTTSYATDGNHSMQIDPADTSDIITSKSGLDYYPQKGNTIKFDFRTVNTDGGGEFVFGGQNDSSYYKVIFSDGYLNQSLHIRKFVDGSSTKYESTSYDIPENEWVNVSIAWNVGNDQITATFSSRSGGTRSVGITDTEFTDGYIGVVDHGDVRHYYDNIRVQGAEQGSYTSQVYDITDPAEGRVNLSALSNASATVSWEADQGDGTWTTVTTSIYSSSGIKSADLSSASADKWRVTVSFDAGSDSVTALDSDSIFFENHHPEIDNADATPQGGVNTSDVKLSVPINDTEFGSVRGDEVQATFFLDGNPIATQNITSNATISTTATVSTGGSHTWHVETIDSYGGTTESDADSSTATNDPYTFQTPSELRIFNESAPNSLVDNVTVQIKFYGGEDGDAFTVERSTDNGVVNMTGLPVNREFIVVVEADSYHNRRIYIESLFEQANVFLLPKSETAVYNVFKIDDKSGSFPPENSRLIIQRALNRSGNLSWHTVSGDFFGSTNEHKTNLKFDERYRLIVANDAGERRVMGPYLATDENNPKVITVSSIVVSPSDGQSYYATSWIDDQDEEDDQQTLRFAFDDPDKLTDSLDVTIYERGNESNVLADVSTEAVGDRWTYSTVLDANESETTWVVNWSAQRDGETIGATIPVGSRGGLSIPMDDAWLSRFGIIALVVVAALSSQRMATIGAMGTVAFAGILMVTGIWEIPVVLWIAALVIAVGGHVLTTAQRGGAVG